MSGWKPGGEESPPTGRGLVSKYNGGYGDDGQ